VEETQPGAADLAEFDLAPPVTLARLPRQGVNNALFLVRTGAETLVLKLHKGVHSAASLRYEHRLLAWLGTQRIRFAVPAPLATRSGATIVRIDGARATLTPHVDAAQLDPARLDHAALLGAALAELHGALRPLPPRSRPGHPLFGALFDYPPARYPALHLGPAHLGLSGHPEAEELLAWWRDEAARLSAFAAGTYRTLPWQLCHNDPAPANVLVGDDRIAALLDFEFACPAPRALDLAMALRMTMRVWESPDPWPAARAVLESYIARAPLTPAEAGALPQLIRLRSAIPVLWKLGRLEQPDDRLTVLRGIRFLRNATTWLELHGARLVELAEATIAAG
jgi:Ser/Thr protein kinase RdoA (MazF antagonist)